MDRSVGLWQFLGFAVVAFGGTLLHFLYEWLGGAVFIAPFSGVNESTWEHMKLLFWPSFLYATVQSFFFSARTDFWCIKRNGILLGLLLIPVLFYLYNGAIGKSPDWLNVAIFFISAALMSLYEARQLRAGTLCCRHEGLAFLCLCAVGGLFILFTFVTPKLRIFCDPLTGTYGI